MTNFIIPAIITLIISITSGLMLDYYKNLAPKILGNVQNGIPIELNSKKLCSYIITVSNPSNKTIHELTLNIQSSQPNLKSTGATITKGLKFDSSIKDNILEVYIPFLSKGDKFSVTAYVENEDAVDTKPFLVIRSPENFNQIDSLKQKGNQLLWFNIPKNLNQVILKVMQRLKRIVSNTKNDLTKFMSNKVSTEQRTNKKGREVPPGNKKPSKNKKAMIITVSIILFMLIGVLEKFYLKGTFTNLKTPTAKITVPKQSTKTDSKAGITGVTGETGSTTKTTDTTKSTGTTTEKPGAKKPTETTTGTAGVKDSTDEKTKTTGQTGSTTGTEGSTDGTKDSTGETTGTTGLEGSTSGTTDSKDGTKDSTGGASGTKDSTEGATGTTGSKEQFGGTAETTGN
ncbi:hypothetical protein K9O30_17740 [Clostridium bowmanii]|uniref:hypothetical protein n=1 Tax=Clostridium bowmanii TaxID=132925 RepID=UPI001C0C4D95|nr:hypothetical protein [Clostridium bowmanii]MBU3191135.1 hypothetical protein [Clostridium bowmanii]MCA1075526.1 hypothetical protein [Clostridium bowmanii]